MTSHLFLTHVISMNVAHTGVRKICPQEIWDQVISIDA